MWSVKDKNLAGKKAEKHSQFKTKKYKWVHIKKFLGKIKTFATEVMKY